jgi:hypothetical protein
VELISVIALSIIGAAGSKLVADEFKAWLPTMINHLIRWAVSLLPEDKRERYAEEWQREIDETPGEIGKLIFGFGLLLAGWRLSRILSKPTVHEIDEIRNAEALLVEAVHHFAYCRAKLFEDPLVIPNDEAQLVEAIRRFAFARERLMHKIEAAIEAATVDIETWRRSEG